MLPRLGIQERATTDENDTREFTKPRTRRSLRFTLASFAAAALVVGLIVALVLWAAGQMAR
ncbi:MAG: hypothetical protein ACYDCK_07945 [Thermoplasmatota archaeon]